MRHPVLVFPGKNQTEVKLVKTPKIFPSIQLSINVFLTLIIQSICYPGLRNFHWCLEILTCTLSFKFPFQSQVGLVRKSIKSFQIVDKYIFRYISLFFDLIILFSLDLTTLFISF